MSWRGNGCPFGGPACKECDGDCWDPHEQVRPEPTSEELCAADGHVPIDTDDGWPRCYCGQVVTTRPDQ